MTLRSVLVATILVACSACDAPQERASTFEVGALVTTGPAPDGRAATLVVTRDGSASTRHGSPPRPAIAALRLKNGATVEFLDTLDERVGIGERAPRREPFVSAALVRGWNATPLEVFLALAPSGTSVPEALRVDHDLQVRASGASNTTPRLLGGSVSFGVGDPGVEEFDCDGFGGNFYDAWIDAFEGVTTYAAVAAMHQLTEAYTFYPGAPVYYGTNTNSVTYFGACNGAETTPLGVEIHRRIKIPTPPTVTYQWVGVAAVALDGYEKYTFYSGIPASYRERVQPANDGDLVEHAQAAAAWTLSPWLGPN